ncbi:transketolase family protein [Flaviflexus ciconiae]|uniref:Transketolase family protein n=1 Tax=Flaviflexus ciconiae TaxID=2496867 RepID=A0A3Q9G893_9ACTO|nr:transketolase C-terminal domain-containing protein [Flaviflexus ciconiae]AZQ77917.1 transketolase family protein [Flaviflexus ciconiae]
MTETMNFDEIISSRSVTGQTLKELGDQYPNLWAITPDIGATLVEFREAFPDRFVDVGLSEQVSVSLASGLAYEGNIVVVSGMLPFLSMRALEQVRSDVCYPNLPVRIIGTHGGLQGNGGSTHYAVEDLGLMSSLVNMTVVSISDPNMVNEVLKQSMSYPGPMYIRTGVGKKDTVVYDFEQRQIQIGKAIVAREGEDITLFTHGEMLVQSIQAARQLEKEGISVRVVDMFTIKPIDVEMIRRCATETGKFVVLEDHLKMSGLAQAISNVLADEGIHLNFFKRLGIPQVYAGFGEDEDLRNKHGYGMQDTLVALREAAAAH